MPKVLLLDDNQDIRDAIDDLGDFIDYNITTCGDPEEALELYTKSLNIKDPYSIVILDLTLQGYDMQGVDVQRKILEINPDVVSVVFSGHSEEPVLRKFQEYGFRAKLEKPINLKEFISTLDTLSTGLEV